MPFNHRHQLAVLVQPAVDAYGAGGKMMTAKLITSCGCTRYVRIEGDLSDAVYPPTINVPFEDDWKVTPNTKRVRGKMYKGFRTFTFDFYIEDSGLLIYREMR